MIYAKLKELEKYVDPMIYKHIKGFLQKLSPDMPEGEYPILGETVYARVMEYETLSPKDGVIEAHNSYIDIQSTLSGAEGISVFARDMLQTVKAYDAEQDVELFYADDGAQVAYTTNIPGYFTMLFPEDAHRPKERVRGEMNVKKFVIKLATG